MPESAPPAPGTPDAPLVPERIEDLRIERELQDSYLTYAMSTIMDRALPDVRDGLKPSQRRILYAMVGLNLTPGRKHMKCARVCGDTMGKYHPHGEAVIYPTLVRLAQEWNIRYPLIDPQGNFGSSDGDTPAAMRYTECRMSHIAAELLADIELDTVDFQPTYDEQHQEPMVLPGKFPNLMVNGSTGIAVGMACNLLPHNLREICNAIVHVIDHPDCSLADLIGIVPGPDFPTGGIICGREGILDGYKNGRGRITLRAKLHVETLKNNRQLIVIDEVPYGVVRKSIVESVAACVKEGIITDVSDANDHSGREHKVRIVIDLKRDADPDIVINQLYKNTPCQITVSMINIALVNRQPRTMGLKELIQHFIAHRKEVITRRTRYLLKKAQQRAHILEGLIYAVCDIDEVIRLIRSSKTRDEAIEKLRQRAFRIAVDHPHAKQIPQVLLDRASAEKPVILTQVQAEAIGRLQLIQLVGLEIDKLVNEYRAVAEEIEGYEAILADESLVMDIIREDTFEMKEKYGDDRRTEVSGNALDLSTADLITPEDVVVTVSHSGYVKRLPVATYSAQGRGGRGIKGAESKEGDYVEHMFVANTHDHLLFFTTLGRVYARRVFDIPEMSRTSAGRAVANLLEMQATEKLTNVLAVKDFDKGEQFLMFATAKGTVKKTALSAYSNIRVNGIIAISLDAGDTLIGIEITSGHDHVMLATKSGLAIRFEEAEVRAMGRPAGGVTGARFKRDGDEVVSMLIVPGGDNAGKHVLTGCVNGFGKRTPLDDYPVKGRGTRGVINIDANERNGDVVGTLVVKESDEVMMITERGILIRTRASEVRDTGRGASGVKLIRLDEGDKLVAMTRVEPEDPQVPEATDASAPAGPSLPAAAPPADSSGSQGSAAKGTGDTSGTGGVAPTP